MSITFKPDKIYIGLLSGIVLPLVVFYIYFALRHGDVDFSFYITMLHRYGLLFKVMSLCVLADLPLFYIFIQLKFWRSARGVVMACFLFAFIVAGYKIFT